MISSLQKLAASHKISIFLTIPTMKDRSQKTIAEKESDVDPNNYHQQQPIAPLKLDQSTPSSAATIDLHRQVAGVMEDHPCTDIFQMLSNVELYPTLPPAELSKHSSLAAAARHDPKPQVLEKAESSEQKAKPNVPELFTPSDHIRRGREQIRRKMKALQDLIPNCNKRDKASMLDDAIRYIKALQNQIKTMSSGGGSMIQTPNLLPAAGYQMVQIPQLPQFMPMNPGIGMDMGLFNVPPSATVPVVPFALPGPCQSTLAAASGTNTVGTMTQLQMPLDTSQSVSSAGSNLMVPPRSFGSLPSTTIVCTTEGESSSQSVLRSINLSRVPVMSQGPGSVMVLPSQIITLGPASSSSSSVVSDVPEIPVEDKDSNSSQRI